MKLALNLEELEQAVSDYIVNNGFPVDVSNASFSFSNDNCEIDFGLENTKKPTKKRKPKKQEEEVTEEPITTELENEEEIVDNNDTEDDAVSLFG